MPPTHDETLRKCKVHALYLGRGLFVELKEWEAPLQILDNPDPKIISNVIGELSELETKMYDDILHTRLGVGKADESKASTSSSVSIPKQMPMPSLDEPQDEAPMDLSLDDKAVPTMQPGPVILLDLSFGQGSDDSSLPKNDTFYESPAILDTLSHHSASSKVLDQPDQQVRDKFLDPKLARTVTVDLKKLDLKVNQTVKVMAYCQKEYKIGTDDQDSASTISYDMGDNLTSSTYHIPEWYIKPRYKLPSSVKSLKAKKRAKFSVKVHGIQCRHPKCWFKCMMSPCKQTFQNTKLWNIHHVTVHKSVILMCDICKKTFTKPSVRRAHRNNHASHKHCCTRCSKTFAYISALRQHKIVHSRQRHKCFSGKCTCSYKYPWDLNRHIKTHLDKEYICPRCPKTFKQERLLNGTV